MNEHTSRELSERLYEKGFRGEHTQEWHLDDRPGHEGRWYLCEKERWWDDDAIRAYTFSELWGVVPHDIIITKQSGGIYCGNRFTVITCRGEQFLDLKSPAEAMGLLVEWLLDNSYIEREG